MGRQFTAGNWKMHGSKESVAELVEALKSDLRPESGQVAVCAPYVYLPFLAEALRGSSIQLGAQNSASYSEGAYTGEISASMLSDIGCSHVILGHSERRTLFGETDEIVCEKFRLAQSSGLIPIFCVGETLEQRENGATFDVLSQQLSAVVNKLGVEALTHSVLAYEPVWAIGTGKTASPEQAQEVHSFLRASISERSTDIADALSIVYGGSVKAENAQSLFSMEDIDGGLIGGASLKADQFIDICKQM